MQPASETAAFYLPGLVHQFGNLLLSVQGHVLHVPADGITRMQEAIHQIVQRGGHSLRIVRALLGDRSNMPGDAFALLKGVIELARVPARERGLGIEWRAEGDNDATWVHGDAFVQIVAETLRHWLRAVPAGSGGVATIACAPASGGGVVVLCGLDAGEGNLPFPVASEQIAAELTQELQAELQDCSGQISARRSTAGIELQVGPAATGGNAPGFGGMHSMG